MPVIKVTDVKVGERFRKTFEGMEELCQSITKHGLIEPIVLDEANGLIAGERRLRAHQMLKLEVIEVKYINELSELEKKEVELEENIQRKQFTWQEEVVAKAQLHNLKQQLHGKAIPGHRSEGWGLADTANALGEDPSNVSIDIKLARGMKAFPELMKEKNKSTAFKKLKSMQEKILQEELSRRLKQAGLVNNPNIIHGNCIEELAKMSAESVDLVLTDPPYGINIEDAHTYGRMTEVDTRFADGEFETFDMLDKLFPQLFRVLKQDRHAFFFCAIDKFPTVIKLLEKHGFWVHQIPLIWDKGSGSYPSQSTTFVHSYEPFIHAMKGKRKLNGTPKDIFSIARVPAANKIHPTEKPTQLLREIITLSTLPGEKVIDTFAGSGATIVAARETNRQGVGIELDEQYYQLSTQRLNSLGSCGQVVDPDCREEE